MSRGGLVPLPFVLRCRTGLGAAVHSRPCDGPRPGRPRNERSWLWAASIFAECEVRALPRGLQRRPPHPFHCRLEVIFAIPEPRGPTSDEAAHLWRIRFLSLFAGGQLLAGDGLAIVGDEHPSLAEEE